MYLTPTQIVLDSNKVVTKQRLDIDAGSDQSRHLKLESNTVAYMPFINAHDHLVSNWYPRAGTNRPYINSHLWVEDMKDSQAYLERNKFWINKGFDDITKDNGHKVALLGAYKNLFSGCAVVQDHIPPQPFNYYDQMPIELVREYTQHHSITLGNWWGGGTASEEFIAAKGKKPFIMHLGEGLDETTRAEFKKALDMGIISNNTILIHCISLTHTEIDKMAELGASICWCPYSNEFLIGESVDIDYAIKAGVNVVIGTDSSMSSSLNMFEEFKFIKKHYPQISMKQVYDMITVNSAKALMLDQKWVLNEQTDSVLVTDMIKADPYENLAYLNPENIRLMVYKGRPLYGDMELFTSFDCNPADYSFISTSNGDKFVVGNPEALNHEVDSVLGYHKDFPYLPF